MRCHSISAIDHTSIDGLVFLFCSVFHYFKMTKLWAAPCPSCCNTAQLILDRISHQKYMFEELDKWACVVQ